MSASASQSVGHSTSCGLYSSLLREIRYLRQCGPHPNVIQLYGSFRAYAVGNLPAGHFFQSERACASARVYQLLLYERNNRRVWPRLLGDGTREICAETDEGGPKRVFHLNSKNLLRTQMH